GMIDELRARVPGARIGLVGASFGAYLSLVAAGEREVAALSLRVPANYLDEGFDAPHEPRFRADVRRPEDLYPADSRALRVLRAFGGPVQLVDADGDAVIPRETIAGYVDAVDPARLTRHTLSGPHH